MYPGRGRKSDAQNHAGTQTFGILSSWIYDFQSSVLAFTLAKKKQESIDNSM